MEHISNLDWKAIPGFPNYAISEDGQIWSYYTKKFLKPCLDSNKYLVVTLYNGLKRKVCRVHRLVGKAFVKLPEEFNNNYDIATINHIDHDKTNNHYTNLEWVTLSCNVQEASDNGYCDALKKSCFCISIEDKKYTPFDSLSDMDRSLNLPEGTVKYAIRINNGLIQDRYIVGATDDPKWKEIPANPIIEQIEQIVESYADQIELYKSRNIGPKKITNLQTGESKIYNSLSEFAREHGLYPKNAGRYLKNHSDLYKVELA